MKIKWTHNPHSHGMVPVGQGTSQPAEIYYELHGHGPQKILLISGLSSSSRAWVNTLNYLLADDAFEVCVFDNRGVGSSTQDTSGFTINDMALDTITLLKHLRWEKDVMIVGHSMGGMICQHVVLNAPEGLFSKVVLMSTTAVSSGALSWHALWTYFWILVGWTPLKTMDDKIEFYLSLGFPTDWLSKPWEEDTDVKYPTNRDALIAMVKERSIGKPSQSSKSRSGQMLAARGHNLSDSDLKKLSNIVSGKLKVFCGDTDYQTALSCSQHLARATGGDLSVFKGGGHLLMDQFPTSFHEQLLQFING